MDLCFLGCLRDVVKLLRTALVGEVPRLLCSSVKSMKIPADRCPEIRRLSCILQYSHCTFVTIFFFVFFAGLIFNLPVRKRALIPEFASRIFFVNDIREDANNHNMVSCTYLWCNLCTAAELTSQIDSGLWDSFLSMYFYHLFLSVVHREERTLVSILRAYSHRAGNCSLLLSNTVLLLSIDSILLVLCQHHVDPCDS